MLENSRANVLKLRPILLPLNDAQTGRIPLHICFRTKIMLRYKGDLKTILFLAIKHECVSGANIALKAT